MAPEADEQPQMHRSTASSGPDKKRNQLSRRPRDKDRRGRGQR